MRNIAEQVIEQFLQSTMSTRKAASGLAFVGVVFSAAASGIQVEAKVAPKAQSAQVAAGHVQEFYISISTDERDQPGLSTVIVAGSNSFMFDCGIVGSEARSGAASRAATALFLTRLDTTTVDGIERARGNARRARPLRIWGPPGTREWMLQTLGNQAFEDNQHPPFTVIDVQEGAVSETGDVTIAAIATAPARLEYRPGLDVD